MTTNTNQLPKISTAAQAVLDAYIAGLASKRRNAIAAALRAAASQLTSAKSSDALRAIAAELEGANG